MPLNVLGPIPKAVDNLPIASFLVVIMRDYCQKSWLSFLKTNPEKILENQDSPSVFLIIL